MKLTAQIKLLPTPAHADALRRTLEAANAACNAISDEAWAQQTFGKYDLQQMVYHQIKAKYELSAQMVIRCLAKVSDSYKLDRMVHRHYRLHGGIAYDDRILSFNLDQQTISIWTVDGRLKAIPFVCGDRQQRLLLARQGESDLALRDGQFFLLVTCTFDEPIPENADAVLGVDLGIVNLATDSDGATYSGNEIERVRQRYQRRRDRLQAVGTKSAKRRLKRNSGRQRRFQQDTNHRIAKDLVATAKGTRRAIALENLKGIRERAEKTVRKSQRSRHSNWAFAQLRSFIEYKARLVGVRMADAVDPRNTSRTCSQPDCGYCDKRNRIDQSHFRCLHCGYTAPADYNAAKNIRDWAVVNRPMASDLWVQAQVQRL